ncbi:hypothetical protein [Halobaculum marinum]|uniref:Uncharacterized protein n=1 Tax=Halobaculum marinum TaxID=3031996 RepID=A0ABD5WVL2_9EURY|nr:hypothetical protein [Halobaculum sp. DT55]
MPETYVCPYCRATVERDYRVQYVIRSCPECGDHGRSVHAEVAAALDDLSSDDLPDGWADRPLDERLLVAVREGLLEIAETRLPPRE